jgi:DNA-directed RNA polymerase sigma subunit (sigma70/sigma32)
MSKIDKLITKMAEEFDDPHGDSYETVEYIASELQISVDEVREVLDIVEEL